jgi:hypothetical protein
MKSIKVLLFLAMFVAFCTSVNAQKKDKCKFDVEKKDEFTGADYKSVKVKMLAKQPLGVMMYNFEFFKNGTEFKLQLNYPCMAMYATLFPWERNLP